MGSLIAAAPVTGSVTLALLTSDPPCDALAPFILIRPSGPRTTPGIKGSNASMRSSLFGALTTVDLSITDWSDEYVESGGSVLPDTVTDSLTASAFNSTGASR